ncbi:TPA: glycosyltransferase [Vibrio parahaemolyticus]|uniref:CgeB family protein n=1 Tax=Vibrio parahaemolyticus TaxID=670 RepID=UPI002269ABCC|nr:glycosyltransferase [Vibrio parahaemolyticus]MCX8764050.1 glycosyltransferase [Vibrio parahaemolyticus]HCE2308377.1 glycosyltransferase [Vibrio parahaemolyticus]HCE4675895.1 glycosyltransferase [Vibrio parahaemolyticus]HCG6407513.1 glycosyltransferase [Vibrio parahaemolyticus]
MIGKSSLKKIKVLNRLNALIKSYQFKRRYKMIVRAYENKEPVDLKKLVFKEVNRVYYFGGDEYQDKSGFLQGLKDNFDIRYFSKDDGEYGQYARSYKNCKESNTKRLEEHLEKLSKEGWNPELLLMQTWAWALDVKKLISLKEKYGFLVANIGMDDRHSYTDHGCWDNGTYGLIPALDFALTCAPECVDWFKKEGINAFYFPEASHPQFYYPDPDVDKIYDVGFVGAKYGLREEIVKYLRSKGVKVTCYGNGWENGRLPLEDTNKFFNQCKIVLGIGTIGHTKDFYALKLRDFDATMAGCVYLTHANQDLYELFDVDKEIILAKDTYDYYTKVSNILFDHELQQEIRTSARQRALRSHNYTDRFFMLKEIMSGKKDKFI